MDLGGFSAVVLAGGHGSRLGGFDKASIEIDGRTLLAHALDAVVDAGEVVVVGAPVPTERPVTFVVENPRYGGPVAALLTGVDVLLRTAPRVAVLAVDMPRLSHATFRRLQAAVDEGSRQQPGQTSGAGRTSGQGADGAVLVGPDGRRQLAMVVDRARLEAVRPDHEGQHDMSLRRLLAPLHLVEVAAVGDEHRDVDTWTDLRDLAGDDPAR